MAMSIAGMSRRMSGRRRICNLFLLLFILLSGSLYLLLDKTMSNATDKDGNIVADNVMVVIRDTREQKEYIDRKGIHVIIGQYMGSSIDWNGSPNLTQDVLNTNNYAPIPKAGELGSAVYIPEFEAIRMKMLYHVNKFNLMASDRISVNRSLPDPRKDSCKKRKYNLRSLPTSSVIIVFHNEAWSTLLRTVHSILNRTPKKLLQEIILVDDASERSFLSPQVLDPYLDQVSLNYDVKIVILRSPERIGLIRARLMGAKVSSGQVLTFLDAHVEVTTSWLEPLLDRISKDPKTVVCPIIDVINDDTFAYAKSFELHWGAMNWNLHFRWFPLGSSEYRRHKLFESRSGKPIVAIQELPFKTPIMAGGLFSIDRKYFYDIGSYDEQMDIWGGENIEMSLRIWTCGGKLEIHPCSHVAHLFRKSSPYTFSMTRGGQNITSVATVLYSNLARVAEVWMDEYKNFFYTMNPTAKTTSLNVSQESLEGRRKLRESLQCKSFQWFLDTVWPEHFFPSPDRFFGQIQSVKSKECLQKPSAGMKGSSSGGNGISSSPVGRVELESCAIDPLPGQSFVYTKRGFIMTDDSVCFDVISSNEGAYVLLLACSEMKRQKWTYELDTKRLVHLETGMCLSLETKSHKFVQVKSCNSDKYQKWDLIASSWNSTSV